ncbi:Phosphatidylinositol-4-phosphate 5-kinase, partial [Quaeritorhiza haematococci]
MTVAATALEASAPAVGVERTPPADESVPAESKENNRSVPTEAGTHSVDTDHVTNGNAMSSDEEQEATPAPLQSATSQLPEEQQQTISESEPAAHSETEIQGQEGPSGDGSKAVDALAVLKTRPHSYSPTPAMDRPAVGSPTSEAGSATASPTRHPRGLSLTRRHTFAASGELLSGPLAELKSKETKSEKKSEKRALKRQRSEKQVLVGTPIREGHANFVLMFDMLSGIRACISRCCQEPLRELVPDDFTATHKFTLSADEEEPIYDIDYKFKDYAPWVFRMIREKSKVNTQDYLPREKCRDYRFIIKTVHRAEYRFLRKMLRSYYQHIADNQHTLISRILGLHRVKHETNKKIYFVVMTNVFPPNKDIHEVYDLKGSTFGRLFPEEEAHGNPRAVLKDMNWLSREKTLQLGPAKQKLFVDQLEKDVAFLSRMKIMDYSLLVGVHDMVKGNQENIRDSVLATFEPIVDTLPRRRTHRSKASSVSEGVAQVGGGGSPSHASLSDVVTDERLNIIFYQDNGGFQSTDVNDYASNELYYLGIIDIFTKYDFKKRVETSLKTLSTLG